MAKKKKEDIKVLTPDYDPQDLNRSVGEITEEAYVLYGGYVNCSRALPRIDGLKVSTARLIYAAMQHPKGKLIPTHELVPSVSKWHPHGTTGLELTTAHLVRSGIFSGSGFWGHTSIDSIVSPPAATRYTKMRISDNYLEIFGDLVRPDYINYHESPQGEMEPDYLPCPLPFALFMPIQTMGLGVATRTNLPSFSPTSLFEAYRHNDPSFLESSVDLILDKKNSELDRLWKTGRGRVVYSYKISRQKSPDGKSEGILFESASECATEIFTPKISKFDRLVTEGKVYIEDLTDENGPKLFIGRVPGARGIAVDDIEAIARKICYSAVDYQLWITDGRTAFRTPMFDWINYTYNNYLKLLGEVNLKRIDKVKFDISVQEAIPVVSDYIINKNPKATDTEIQQFFGMPQEIVEAVMSKPIGYLRKNKDTSDRIKTLKDKLRDLKKFDPVKYTEEIINKL